MHRRFRENIKIRMLYYIRFYSFFVIQIDMFIVLVKINRKQKLIYYRTCDGINKKLSITIILYYLLSIYKLFHYFNYSFSVSLTILIKGLILSTLIILL